MKRLEVIQLDDVTWEVFIDGNQTGQYPTAAAAKSAAKRRLPSWTPRLEWSQPAVDRWLALVVA